MRGRMSVKTWSMAAAFLAAPALAVAQANTPVATVLYFDNNSFGKDRGDYDGLGKGIADLLINDMASNPAMRIVERERIQSILLEHALGQSKTMDAQSVGRIGKLLGSQYL